MEEAWRPLKEAIKNGSPDAYALFKKVDHLTVREYLRDKMFEPAPLDPTCAE